MNRKEKTSNIGVPMLILLFVAGAIVATGGIGYVVLKNKQVTARRDITKVQQRMEEHRAVDAQPPGPRQGLLQHQRVSARSPTKSSSINQL